MRSLRAIGIAAAVVVAVGMSSGAQATLITTDVIDLYPRNDSINSLQASEFYAQTFVATGAVAEMLTFDMQTNGFGTGRADTAFQVLLTTVVANPFAGYGGQSPIKPGTILFESGNLVLGAEADWTQFAVDLGGLPLSIGTSYAWVLDALTPWDRTVTEVGARVGAVRNSFTGTPVDDAYPQGMFLFSSGACCDRAASFASANWVNLSSSDYRDLVFRLDFTNPPPPSAVPEPSTLALFGAGIMGLGAMRRRRKAKAWDAKCLGALAVCRTL